VNAIPLLVASVAFALYVTCPRMTAMISSQAKISGFNPLLVITLGCVLGIPMFLILFYAMRYLGVEVAVILAAVMDFAAALMLGKISLRAGVELAVITIFVYAGIRVAPIIAKALVS